MSSSTDLSLSEWAVLGLVAEGQTHGFIAGREFAPDGSIGKIWTIPRPLVYRAITSLGNKGLVIEIGSAPGSGGPRRRLVEVTPDGRAALGSWLAEPVRHVRDARSALLIKLLLLDRAGRSPLELLLAQQALLEPMLVGLRLQLPQSKGFDSTLTRWRLYSTEALARLLAELIGDQQPPNTHTRDEL